MMHTLSVGRSSLHTLYQNVIEVSCMCDLHTLHLHNLSAFLCCYLCTMLLLLLLSGAYYVAGDVSSEVLHLVWKLPMYL